MSGCLQIAVICLILAAVAAQTRSRFNPSIIQDSRLEPNVDGTFGFQYRTEDGISHAAHGDPSGFIQGSYSYKDPTGLKVNINYFAGARANNAARPQYNNPPPQYNNPPPQQYYRQSEPPQYQPAPEPYRPMTRPPASYTRPQYEPQYNEVYDANDYQYKG